VVGAREVATTVWAFADYTSAIMLKKSLLRWLPALVIMAVIFGFSNTPSTKLPSFGLFDFVVKKGGHMTGYGLLALAYWYGLRFEKRRWWLAPLFAILYAITDEFHQSFVPGRHPSWVDVLGFDGGGALIALALGFGWFARKKRLLKSA
jgi:VanZ family protein